MEKEKDRKEGVKDFVRAIESYARKRGLLPGDVLNMLTKTLVNFLTYDPASNRFYANEGGKGIKDLVSTYFYVLRNELEQRDWVDLFGDFYMQTSANVKGFGQCFTPDCLCDLLSQLVKPWLDKPEGKPEMVRGFGMKTTMYDCAAGSARLLLAAGTAYRKETKNNDCYLMAADVDERCCRMSALNMLVHGFYGEVVCMDTLMGNAGFRWGYIVNGGLYPIPFGLPSLEFSTDPSMFHQLIKSK